MQLMFIISIFILFFLFLAGVSIWGIFNPRGAAEFKIRIFEKWIKRQRSVVDTVNSGKGVGGLRFAGVGLAIGEIWLAIVFLGLIGLLDYCTI